MKVRIKKTPFKTFTLEIDIQSQKEATMWFCIVNYAPIADFINDILQGPDFASDIRELIIKELAGTLDHADMFKELEKKIITTRR